MSTVSRWYLYDTGLSDNINDLADGIGLSRISEEGETKEQEDSDRRMDNTEPLFSFLHSMSELSATVMSVVYMNEMAKEAKEIDPEELEEMMDNMHNVYKVIALSTLMGTFSSALELGIISSNILSSDTYLAEGDLDE